MAGPSRPADPGNPPSGRGPVFDDAMKLLHEVDLAALTGMLDPHGGLGVAAQVAAGAPVVALPAELAESAIRPDLVVQVGPLVVHAEYVKARADDLPWRMTAYRVRLAAKHPTRDIIQVVLVLDPAVRVPARYTNGTLTCSWEVVHAATLDPAALLRAPVTAALAALTRPPLDPATLTEPHPTEVAAHQVHALSAAVRVIAAAPEPHRTRLAHATRMLASITCPVRTIETVFQEAGMPVPVTDTPYGQYLLDLGEQQGRAIGEKHGRAIGEKHGRHAEAVRYHALILRHRFPDHADHPLVPALAEHLAELPPDQAATLLFHATWTDLAGLLRPQP